MNAISPRQREVRDFIRDFHARKGYPATLREIGDNFKIAVGSVQTHLEYLQKAGALTWEKGKPRTIMCNPLFKD